MYYKTPPYLQDHSKIAIVELLKTAEERKYIYKTIWNQLALKLDTR